MDDHLEIKLVSKAKILKSQFETWEKALKKKEIEINKLLSEKENLSQEKSDLQDQESKLRKWEKELRQREIELKARENRIGEKENSKSTEKDQNSKILLFSLNSIRDYNKKFEEMLESIQ